MLGEDVGDEGADGVNGGGTTGEVLETGSAAGVVQAASVAEEHGADEQGAE